MFGYVRPLPDELKVRDLRVWREDYCGLCRCLGKRYGFAARFLLSYDMTFLYGLLTMDGPAPPAKKCWCPAAVVRCKACRPADPAMEYAADLTVLLMWWKLRDERRDGGFLRRTAAGAAMLLFRRAYRQAAARQPELDALIRTQLDRLARLEAASSPSLDETADAFASILRGCAAFWTEPARRRPAEQLLYQVGRYIYLIDALDDLPKDCRSGAYNPLRCRFQIGNGALRAEDKAYLLKLMDCSIDLCGAAFELLPRGAKGAVPENIIYYGLPAVLRAVSEGRFDHRKKQVTTHERPL